MKKKSNKINFKSNSSRAIYNYVLENNYKITVKQACDELAVTPSQVYSLIGLLRKKGMNVRVIRKSVERQIYREARQYIEEHNCEISIAKACRDLNVSREQLNNMIHKFRKNGMQISIIQASDIIKLPLNKNTEEAVYQYLYTRFKGRRYLSCYSTYATAHLCYTADRKRRRSEKRLYASGAQKRCFHAAKVRFAGYGTP